MYTLFVYGKCKSNPWGRFTENLRRDYFYFLLPSELFLDRIVREFSPSPATVKHYFCGIPSARTRAWRQRHDRAHVVYGPQIKILYYRLSPFFRNAKGGHVRAAAARPQNVVGLGVKRGCSPSAPGGASTVIFTIDTSPTTVRGVGLGFCEILILRRVWKKKQARLEFVCRRFPVSSSRLETIYFDV